MSAFRGLIAEADALWERTQAAYGVTAWPEPHQRDYYAMGALRATRTAMQRLSSAMEWRDMEDAPTDGTRILLALSNGAVVIGKWTNEDARNPVGPTRWLPLPPGPSA